MIKQNFKILISVFCVLQNVASLQADQAGQLINIIDVVKALPKPGATRQPSMSKQPMPKIPKSMPKQAKAQQECAINVFSVRVLGQDHHPWPAGNIPDSAIPWATAAQGEGGNCGYHALKNVTGLIASLDKNGNRDPQGVWALAQFPLYQNFMQRAVPIVAALGVRESLTWLDGGQLEALVDQMESPVPIVIAENVTGFGFADNVLLALRNFAVNPDGALGIIWNAGITHYEARIGAKAAKIQSGGVHWVGFVAVKKTVTGRCNITLYSMDSAGDRNAYVAEVSAFLSLTPAQIDEMLRAKALMQALESIDNLDNPDRTRPLNLEDVLHVVLHVWRDFDIPLHGQQRLLHHLERQLLQFDAAQLALLAADVRLLQALRRLNLVDQTRIRTLLPDFNGV